MRNNEITFKELAVKSMVVHTISYFFTGILALVFLDYASFYAETELKYLMRPVDSIWVLAGPLFQPLRGLLFAVAFYVIQPSLFQHKFDWLKIWLLLVILGVANTFGPSPGSIEGLIYTKLPVWVQLKGLPEVFFQSLLLSYFLFQWVVKPNKKAVNWSVGTVFVILMLLPILGLLNF